MTPQESMAKKNSLSMVQTRKDYSERQSRKKEQHGGERKNSMVEKERTAWRRKKEQHGGERKNSMVEIERVLWYRSKEQHGGERKNSMVDIERTAWWR